jgi:hypothetical protein
MFLLCRSLLYSLLRLPFRTSGNDLPTPDNGTHETGTSETSATPLSSLLLKRGEYSIIFFQFSKILFLLYDRWLPRKLKQLDTITSTTTITSTGTTTALPGKIIVILLVALQLNGKGKQWTANLLVVTNVLNQTTTVARFPDVRPDLNLVLWNYFHLLVATLVEFGVPKFNRARQNQRRKIDRAVLAEYPKKEGQCLHDDPRTDKWNLVGSTRDVYVLGVKMYLFR